MDEKTNITDNFGKYFNFNQWILENQNELRLRLYLMEMEKRLHPLYLRHFFQQGPTELDEKYKMFIEYMTQGFNRTRKELEEKHTSSIIRNAGYKYKWVERAKRWERYEIRIMTETLQIKDINNPNNSWSQKDTETNFQYFTFLCYLQLGSRYSFSTLMNILNEYGINTNRNTISMFASNNNWHQRRNDYNGL